MKTLYFITGPSLCQRHDASALKGHVCVDCLLESICGHEIRSMKEIMATNPIRTLDRSDGSKSLAILAYD